MPGMHRDRVSPEPKKKKRLSFQRVMQLLSAVFFNGYAAGFQKGKIFTGGSKAVCVPVLNCYSCPGALGACPIGSLQAVLGHHRIPFYVLGLLMLFGVVLGRVVCGLLCPFGFVQDRVRPKFCVNSLQGGEESKIYVGRQRHIRLPPCQQHNAGGGGCQGRRSRAFTLDIQARRCYSGMRPAKKTAIWAWIRLQS